MSKCLSCQINEKRLAGTATDKEINHWMMWGCTCDPKDAEEANEWMNRVTR